MDGIESRTWGAIALVLGGCGLLLSLALEADIAISSGIWYPIIYGGIPAVAATAAFAHERRDVRTVRLLGVGGWLLVSSVFAMAVTVLIALGSPADLPPSPVLSLAFAVLLYAGFLGAPLVLAGVAGRRRGIESVASLAVSPIAQVLIAAVLFSLR